MVAVTFVLALLALPAAGADASTTADLALEPETATASVSTEADVAGLATVDASTGVSASTSGATATSDLAAAAGAALPGLPGASASLSGTTGIGGTSTADPPALALTARCPTCPVTHGGTAPPGDAEPSAAVMAASAGAAAAAGLAVAAKTGLLARLAAWAAGSLGLSLFSRINKDEALAHPARQNLIDLASATPGIDMRTCQDRLGVAWGTLVHHVQRLEDTGHLVSARHGNYRRLFVAGTKEAAARDAWMAVEGDTPKDLARAVLRCPGATQQDLRDETGVSASVASKLIKRFANAGLVEVKRVARHCHVEATPRLAMVLGNELSGKTPLQVSAPRSAIAAL